jgi:hypothetical protein
MPKPPKVPTAAESEPTPDQSPKPLSTTICRNVIAALGRPGDLLRITARQVSGDSYRVNVVTGMDNASARIAHSFFVVANENGDVTGSAPAIVKQY